MGLFRDRAVRHYTSPDRVGGLVEARPASGLLALAAIVACVAAMGGLAFSIEVPRRLAMPGVLRAEGGALELRAPRGGALHVFAAAGERVEAGSTVFLVDSDRGATHVTAPVDGVVDRVEAGLGTYARRGLSVATLVPEGPREAWLLAPARQRAVLEAGAPVALTLAGSTEPVEARIRRVRSELLTRRRAQELGLPFEVDEPSLLVEVDLPEGAGAHGALVEGALEHGHQSLLSLLLP